MDDKLKEMLLRAEEEQIENKKFLQRLKKKRPKNLDVVIHGLHDDVFEEIDCLDCANCCKTLGPRLIEKDIERIAKLFRKKSAAIISEYLRVDEDGDYVFRQMPCPFLMDDNYCMIYESRPRACREYPHTEQRKIYQILDITQKNTLICPAVSEIVERAKGEF